MMTAAVVVAVVVGVGVGSAWSWPAIIAPRAMAAVILLRRGWCT
jgi:hypothetical protein